MKKTSDKVASRVGKFVLGIGLIAAIVCPFAGAGLAAWSTGAAAIHSLGVAAGVPLAGAGALGGFVLGSIAAPFVAGLSVGLSGLAWGATKAIGNLVEWMAGSKQQSPAAPPPAPQVGTMQLSVIDPKGMEFYSKKLGATFDAAKNVKAANENKPQQNKPQPMLQKLLRHIM